MAGEALIPYPTPAGVAWAARRLCDHVKGESLRRTVNKTAEFEYVDRYGRRFLVTVAALPEGRP